MMSLFARNWATAIKAVIAGGNNARDKERKRVFVIKEKISFRR